MSRLDQWLAGRLRQMAQDLEPPPDLEPLADPVPPLQAEIDQLRAEITRLNAAIERIGVEHGQEMREKRDELARTEAALHRWEAGHTACLPLAQDALYAAACRVVADLAATSTASGEHKRHQAYAALLDQFPQRARRDLSLAIEGAVRRILA